MPMSEMSWMPVAECPLLDPQSDADPAALRMVQRLFELALTRSGSDEVAKSLLEAIAASLHADSATVLQATPEWKTCWQHQPRMSRAPTEAIARPTLNDVLDRQAGVSSETKGVFWIATCLSYVDRPNRVLAVVRSREPFARHEFEYAVAAGHALGVSLEHASHDDNATMRQRRLASLVEIGRQLVRERETIPLLEHIAAQAAELLGCERASIFLWDKDRQELVGRPALGLPNNELRIADKVGIVGRVVHSGKPQVVDDVREGGDWSGTIDRTTGFKTRNILCVPMRDEQGNILGAVEVMNKKERYIQDDAVALEAFGMHVALALQNVRERESLVRANAQLEDEARLASRLVGQSPAILALRDTVQRVARTDLPVLVMGESGSGKDVVARAVHFASPRQQQPYIPVNCAAIAETLLESELFGHEKGAFTDAHTTRAGKFEAASGGTLFLDEIGDLSASGQAKLLRVLEEKVVYRVGGTTPIPVDVRIVAATNRVLAEHVRAGKFREDLFYRLSVVTIDLPPLRDRRDDVLVLADHFLEQFCRAAGRKMLKMTAEARKRLEQHNWPGNIRELRNLLERVAYLCPEDKVEATDLAFILAPTKNAPGGYVYDSLTLAEATDDFQREHIRRTIKKAGGNVSEAAKLLGVFRPNLYRKMRALGMNGDESSEGQHE